MSIRLRRSLLPAAAALVLPVSTAHAQGWMQRVRKAAEQAATDAGRAAVRGDTARAARGAAAPTATASTTPPSTATAPAAPPNAAGNAAPNTARADSVPAAASAWANYDFTPGVRPLYVDDFTADAVGDFPKRLKWQSGTAEVVEWQGGRWLRATSIATFAVPLPEVLPERFTLEFQVAAPSAGTQEVAFGPDARGADQPHLTLTPALGGILGRDASGGLVRAQAAPAAGGRGSYEGQVFPVRVQADGRHVKVYLGETRVANVPDVDLGRDRRIAFRLSAAGDRPVFISAVRVMAGGKPLYEALAAQGRVTTQGIYFATGSDALRPESTPTLKEIAAMLADHPDLKLTIEGHTDAVGDAAANQALSARRAAAVEHALVSQYGADAARLASRGFGATRPAGSNGTAEGRQANRRVELVRR